MTREEQAAKALEVYELAKSDLARAKARLELAKEEAIASRGHAKRAAWDSEERHQRKVDAFRCALNKAHEAYLKAIAPG